MSVEQNTESSAQSYKAQTLKPMFSVFLAPHPEMLILLVRSAAQESVL